MAIALHIAVMELQSGHTSPSHAGEATKLPAPPVISELRPSTPPIQSIKSNGSSSIKKFAITLAGTAVGLVGIAIGLLALNSISQKIIWAKDQDKIQIIEKLSGLKYPDQLGVAKTLCTVQGDSFLPPTVSDKDGFLDSTCLFTRRVKTSGTTCDIEMRRDLADGNSRIWIRLINQNGWKFDDVLVVEWKGKKVGENGLLMSALKENPELLSKVEINFENLKKGYDGLKDIIGTAERLKKLFGDSEKKQQVQDPQAVSQSLF